MKYFYFLIFLFFISCGDGTNTSDYTGELGNNCYKNNSCNEGLICINNKCETDFCKDVTCSNHGICEVQDKVATCKCDTGYDLDGLDCIIINHCKDVNCLAWENCNSDNGKCELKSGFCNDSDLKKCKKGQICTNHVCETPDPCKDVVCGDYGTCIIENNVVTCKCEEGYHINNLECVKDIDPCENITCGNHGTCAIANNNILCACEDGYHPDGLNCIINNNTSLCDGITCNSHGTCAIVNDTPLCACEDGYHPDGLNCIINNLCEGITCNNHGTCTVENNAPICICISGYHPDGLLCVANSNNDLCEGITCSNHGTCNVENNAPVCICVSGYHPNSLNCISDDKCINVNCSSWKSCNPNNGLCELKSGYCEDNDLGYCNQGDHCLNHRCVQDLCESVTCNAWRNCNSNNGQCELRDGYCENNDLSNCQVGQICAVNHRCQNNPCENVTCDGKGSCFVNDLNNPECNCDQYYDLSYDKLHCNLSPQCSPLNLTGTCESECDVCSEGTCTPDGTGYLCNGGFNHRCNPENDTDNGRNTDCSLAAPYCENDPDDPTQGYCYNYGCKTDLECQTANYDGRSQDNFFCFQYGYTAGQQAGTSRHLDGVCMKASASCSDISRDGADYSYCDDTCNNAQCKPTSWCLSNTCIPECDPTQANSCVEGKECKNINSESFPLYRCVETVEEGEKCGGIINCVDGTICLGSDTDHMWCLKTCNSENDNSCGQDRACHPYGAPGGAPTGYYCDGQKTQEVGEMCNFAKDCLDGGICLGTGSGDQYCMATCTAEAETSPECDGRNCNAYGEAPNDGFFCDAEPDRNKLEACNLGHPCITDLICITHNELDSGYCFDSCKTDGVACSDNRDCQGISQITTEGFCNEGCMIDNDCTVTGETCLPTFQCGVQ